MPKNLIKQLQLYFSGIPQKADGTSGEGILVDYNTYVMTRKEKLKYLFLAAAALCFTGYLFFNNVFISCLFAAGAFLYPSHKARELAESRQAELSVQFKDSLQCLSTSLGAGKSLESAFKASLNDLRFLYPHEDAPIIREYEYICRRLELNESLENALFDFARRSGLEDIQNFAEIVAICKKSGGNLIQVIKNTTAIMTDKIEIVQDIALLLARQKYEQRVLNIMPVVFIAVIRYGGAGYMDSLYSSVQGYLLMAVALGILAASYAVSRKITNIRV